MTCHHLLWTAHTVERRRVGHAIIAFGQHTQSKDVGRGMISHAFGQHTRSNDVGRDIPSPPLDSTHDRTMSHVACHHCLWASHTVERRRVWHDISAFGQHTRSNDVGRDMPSPLLESTQRQTTWGVVCYHRLWAAHTVGRCRAWHDIIALKVHRRSNDVGRCMTSPPLDNTDGRTTSSLACHQ